MSIFGSLFTAVSGLTAQSQAMGMISNNIANISTVGYKRTDAAFSSLVTGESKSTLYSPGSVKATQNQRVSLQGILQQSASATDLAMSGGGFFIVKNSTSNPTAETLFTRAGSFNEDQDGNLKNTSGFNLYGWALDASGNRIGSTSNISGLVPVNVAFAGGLAAATTTAELDANLDASQVVSGNPTDFSRDLTIFDSTGSAHTLNLNFTKHVPTAATMTGTLDLTTVSGNFVPGTDAFDIDSGAGPVTITMDGDVNKLLTDLNAVPGVNAQLDANGFLVLQQELPGPANNLTLSDGAGTPLANGTIGLAAAGPIAGTTAIPLTGTSLVNAENPNGWWDVQINSDVGSLLPTAALTQSINFNPDGTLNATLDTNNQVNLSLGPINWITPAGADPQSISLDLAGMTQFAGDYTVSKAEQNGTELGFRTGVSVDHDGIVSCQFSNGLSRQVYQLGIANFANQDGLTSLTGNVYRVSDVSGLPLLNQANTGGAGSVEGGALEESNVDLADEFSKMIVTQRAYSANTKVITTADQMTQELLQLR